MFRLVTNSNHRGIREVPLFRPVVIPAEGGYTAQTWGLDSLGNILSFTDSANGANETRTTDPANEILSINDQATPVYDAAGNMITTPSPLPSGEGQGEGCIYDAWNRLVSVTGGTSTVTYSYDGTGRLVETAVSGGATTYSYYDGQNAIETRVNGTAASNVQYQYVYSPLGDGKTPILRDSTFNGNAPTDTGRLYYLTDANSNVTAVVGYNTTGVPWQVAERYSYDAYGSVTVYDPTWTTVRGTSLANSAVGNTVGFASMVFDPNTGLYNDEARWYSTAVSTFISRDPAMADENLYRYCENEPTDGTDPSGKCIYLYQGNTSGDRINDLFHKEVIVDIWHRGFKGYLPWSMGMDAFSFGAIDRTQKKYDSAKTWLGFNIQSKAKEYWTGKIYTKHYDVKTIKELKFGVVLGMKKTTMEEDMNWDAYMKKRVGLKDRYSVEWFNCRYFSDEQFAEAPKIP